MRDGGFDGLGGPPLPGVAVARDEQDLDTPNCPDCLTRMQAEESASGEAYWACGGCGLVALA